MIFTIPRSPPLPVYLLDDTNHVRGACQVLGDANVVNCIEPHTHQPLVLATSGEMMIGHRDHQSRLQREEGISAGSSKPDPDFAFAFLNTKLRY
jgi:hypothetical protein